MKARWSPEQIAGRLVSDGVCLVRVCKETIYRFIYDKEDNGLALYEYLPEARRKRRPLRSRKPRDGAFPSTQRISERPDIVGQRLQFGHWEGDLLIFDRGTEFAGFRALEDGIGASSWFCDPSAPWQKGTVENTNKRLRRYLPGNTDLMSVSQRDLTTLARHLNNQPGKCLGYKTPAEVFMANLHGSS